MATICYFNAAESAHLNNELQTAYDYYLLILAIGEKMSVPTKMVSEAQKLMSEIPVVELRAVHDVKTSLKRGEVLVGTFVLEFGGSAIATLLASAGADFMIADLEHSSFSIETVGRIVRNARGANLPCIVRVPALERYFISRVLDAGATGVMIPRVESCEDIEKIKMWTKYAPEGDRGVAFGIGHTDYGDFTKLDTRKYVRDANQEILTIGQVETVKAVENLKDILTTGELDVMFIGPYDLSTSMGISGELDHPRLLDAIKEIIRTCTGTQYRFRVLCQRF